MLLKFLPDGEGKPQKVIELILFGNKMLLRLRHKLQKPSNDAAFERLKDWLFMVETLHVLGLRWICDAVVLLGLEETPIPAANYAVQESKVYYGIYSIGALVGVVSGIKSSRACRR